MAEIRPLCAWRYNKELSSTIEELTAPLFDVVSESQLKKLYQNPINSIHLSVPNGDNHAERVRMLTKKWKKEGIIQQDEVPGIYVYFQYFNLPNSDKEYCRKGFVANMRIYDWDEKVLLRHENTMPHSVEDRIEVLDSSQMNISPTHGLYTDDSHEIEKYLDESMQAPLYEVEDYQGVRDVLSVIRDEKVIGRILDIIKDKQIILADGHHRYEGSLLYMKNRQSQNPQHTGDEGYNFHMMYFTNTESDDLRILPTHRLVSGLPSFEKGTFLEKIADYFTIREIENQSDLAEIILGKKYAFGLMIGEDAYKVRLKEGLETTIDWKFPQEIKELELTVLHYFIIEKCLGILGKDQRSSRNLGFERNFTECLSKAKNGDVQLAIVTQGVPVETVKKVCYSGFTLPQKSTYFYPKVICGFLFGSIHPDEFH